MTFAVTSPVTGSAQTGFTTPSYTTVLDVAPDTNGKKYAVIALGGTQAGVGIHSMSSPFSTTFWRPKTFKSLGKPNPTTGLIGVVPNNVFKLYIHKGVVPLAGQPVRTAEWGQTFSIPAGADTADAPNIRAMISFGIGVLTQNSAGLGDSLVTGIV